MVVGFTSPLNSLNKSIIGEIALLGSTFCFKTLEQPGFEALSRIDFNGTTYTAAGVQTDPVSLQDVVMFDLSPGCIINSKKIFNSLNSDEFANDLEIIGGDFYLAGKIGNAAVIYHYLLGTGASSGGVQSPSGYTYSDLESVGTEMLSIANPLGSGQPRIMRFGTNLFPAIWEVEIFGVSSLNQIVEHNGEIYAIGTAIVSGLSRSVIIRIDDTSGPQIVWAKYMDDGESGYIGGSMAILPSGDLSFVDGREHPLGFGLNDIYLSITDDDLNAICTKTVQLDLNIESTLFESPEGSELTFYDVPPTMFIEAEPVEWEQKEICSDSPDPDTCVCVTPEITLFQNGIEYTLECKMNGTPAPVVGCPTGTVSIGGFFGCIDPLTGEPCPIETPVVYTLTGPGGGTPIDGGTSTNYAVYLFPASYFQTNGTYQLMLTTLCPGQQDSCVCVLEWIVECDTACCTDSLAFVAAAQNVNTFGTLGDCEISFFADGLTDCMQITYFWGDNLNSSTGPITGNNVPVSFTYTGPGTYYVCYRIDELNNGDTCWSYTHCDSVLVLCDTPSLFDCGEAVVTCYSGSNPGNYVMAVFEVNDYANQTPLTNWLAPSYHHQDWTASRMGEVFGIAIDAADNIYVTATKVYSSSNALGVVGSAGTGGIYKIDAVSGAVSDFVTTCNVGGPCGPNQLENTSINGPGLGNICYDSQHGQFFVTNMEDGKIYQIDISGNIVNSFDPFNPASGNPGIERYGELLWGIGVQTDNVGVRRVYFGVYNNDSSNGGTQHNQIYSIALDAAGNFLNTSAVLEITLPPYSSWNSVVTNPVADIEFSFNGQKMLIAERTMLSSSFAGFQTHSYSHESRVMEFMQLPAGTWNPVPAIFYIGHYNSPKHANAAGGVDYGYKGIDPTTGSAFGCDSMVWATGDALRWESTQRTYGISGIPSSGNAPSPDGINFGPLNSYYIDVDGEVGSADKTFIGDVDIFKCGCPQMAPMAACDSSLIAAQRRIPPLDSCCWTIDLNIQEPNICRIEFDIETSGVIFNQFTATNFPISLDAINPNTQISIHNNLVDIPSGFYAGEVDFCLTNILNASQVPQYVVVKYYKCIMDQELLFCKDTLEFGCEYPDTSNGCWSSVVDSVYCNPDNQSYTIKLTVTNEDDVDIYNYLGILNVLPSACFTLASPSPIPFNNPLGPGDSEQVCLTVHANKFILDTTNVYFQFYLFSDFACCHAQDSLCIPLPPCCDPCENAIVQVDSVVSVFDSCCYTMDVTNGCANNFFKRIETEIITPGVKFSQAQVISGLPYVWYTPYGDDTEIHWAMQGGFIPVQSFDNLINFCLTDINDPTQNPQCVEVRWIACDVSGKDSIACVDTLKFYCPPVKQDSCIEVVERQVVCLPDGSYQFNYTIQNISTHFASHFTIYNVTPSPPNYISPLGGPGLVNLNPSGFYSGTLNITGGQAGDVVKLKTRLFDFTPPPPGSLFDTAWCCFDTICIVLPPCDTCYCADPPFTNLHLSTPGWSGISIDCETSYENIPCPQQGNGYVFTGKFECIGDTCEDLNTVYWELNGPGGTNSGPASASPYFTINLLPSYISQPGIYTMTLLGFCDGDTCKCEFQFVVDCPDLCPCDSIDFQADIKAGFSTTIFPAICKVCYTPNSLSDCDDVEWYINGISEGTTQGSSSFCQTYTSNGIYNVMMYVKRKRLDGSVCLESTYTKHINVICATSPNCNNFTIENASFNEGAIAGGLNSGGASNGWIGIGGDPIVVNGSFGSLDDWTIQLLGNRDTASILSQENAICIKKDTGTIILRGRVPKGSVFHGGAQAALVIQVHIGNLFELNNCNGFDCYELASIQLSDLLPDEWNDVVIPYDLRNWIAIDSCADGEGVLVRPAIFVTNALNSNQGGAETYSFVQVDNFCLDGLIVAVTDPQPEQNFRIYPNPNNGEFTLDLPEPAIKGMSFRILSLTGQLLLEKTAELGSSIQRIETNNISEGMYFVQILSEKGVMGVSRFVKQ